MKHKYLSRIQRLEIERRTAKACESVEQARKDCSRKRDWDNGKLDVELNRLDLYRDALQELVCNEKKSALEELRHLAYFAQEVTARRREIASQGLSAEVQAVLFRSIEWLWADAFNQRQAQRSI